VAISQGLDAVVRETEKAVLKIDYVSAHVHCADRPPVGDDFVAAREPGDEQARAFGLVSVPHEVASSSQRSDGMGQTEDCRFLIGA
jgi:hypothetical protein